MNQILGKRGFLTVVAVLVFLAASYIVGYVYCSNHVSFEVASKYIASSPSINSEIGAVKSIRLEFFGYELELAGTTGNASYEIEVKGEKRVMHVIVELKKNKKGWDVSSAKIQEGNRDISQQRL